MALTPFRLPRLQRRIAIVGGDKTPTDMFHRYLNMDLVPGIERALNSIQDQVAAIAAAQEAAAAAQADAAAAQGTADEALETAQAAGGSQYITISGSPPASAPASGVVTSALASAIGEVAYITIDANASTILDVGLSEQQGATTNLLGTFQVEVTSDGTQNVDLSWNVLPFPFAVSGVGALSGSVTYILDLSYVSGALIVTQGPLSANVTITRPASP